VPRSVEEVREIALMNNPLVLKHREQVNEAEAMIAMSRQMNAPNFMISGTYSRAEYDMSNMMAMMMPMPMEELKGGFSFGAGIVVPVWFGVNKARVKKARSMLAAEKAKLEKEELSLVKDAAVYLAELDDAERQIDLLDKVLIPKARQTLELVTETYTSGKSSILDFLDAEKTLLDLQIKRVDQVKRREITAAEIVICCLAKY
jgi:outer membrane protein TolC